MPHTQHDKLGGRNVAAFLDMLAVSEGTDDGRQPTKCSGYDVIVGGSLTSDLSKHPRRLVQLRKPTPTRQGLSSTAAGRYQFIVRTWDELAKQLKLPDFGPEAQDLAAVALLKRRNAYVLVQAGKFDQAVHACRKEWASLPGAGYQQHEQKIERLRAAYLNAGGTIA